MNKFLNKVFLISASVLVASSVSYAKNTVCYKNNWNTPSTIEMTPFDGGECKGKYSIKDMEEMGWNILDIKVDSSQNNLNYKYLLTTDEIKTNDNSNQVKKNKTTKKLSFQAFGVKIDNLENNKTTINIGNLIVGQSGVVIHLHKNNKRLIVANAKVVSSTKTSSVVEFTKFDDLKQDALPTSKRTVEKGDVLALNYLYNSSLLIAPNQETFQSVRANFKYNNFVHSDIFAVTLKDKELPLPNKKTIQDFAINQNLGTIFIVVNNKVNVLDTKTFTLLTSYNIDYNTNESQLPFYTRIEKIEESALSALTNFSISDFSLKGFKEDYIKIRDLIPGKSEVSNSDSTNNELNYENYYKRILGL